MTDGTQLSVMRRREFLAAGTALSVAGVPAGTAMASEQESANEALVTRFCTDWATRDIDHLAEFLAEDVVYQVFEGRPLIEGREAFRKQMGPFIANLERVEWQILRSHVIGPLVINERVDHFYAGDGGRDMHFDVAGYFLVKDGLISVWKDFSMPGGQSIIGEPNS